MRYFDFKRPAETKFDKVFEAFFGHSRRVMRESFDVRTIRESKDIGEFRNFIDQFITDPAMLTINQSYAVTCIMFDLFRKEIQLEVYKEVSFNGIKNNEFSFTYEQDEIQIPVIEEYGQSLIATLVFTEHKRSEQFEMLVRLKYGGYSIHSVSG